MYWLSPPVNGIFAYKETDGGWFELEDILNTHSEWADPT